ncbi:MAG: hypothetical protein H7248_02960 [Microbacteriaceae bacterium]|nr:hypothetical protein [Microbacteriaceae bacterium]
MIETEQTRQQLDPAGTLGAFAPTVVFAMIASGWAVCVTLISTGNRGTPVLDSAIVVLLALMALLFVRSASPLRAPFSSMSHLLIHATILAAFSLHAAATWGDPSEPPGGWGPYTLGIMFLAIGPYRPARELVTFGTASAIAMAVVVYIRAAATVEAPFAVAAGTIVPALAFCYGSSRYSGGVVAGLRLSRARSDQDAARLVDQLRGGISRAVRDSRVTILDRDVTPFFADLIARGEVTGEDRHRAREIAQSIREVMVADANRSWLQVAIAGLRSGQPNRFTVIDPQLVAPSASSQQRTALRAFLVAIDVDSRVESVVMQLAKDGGYPSGHLEIHSKESSAVMRNRYDPYLAVMKIEFPEFAVEAHRNTLIVRFGFDHS